MKPLRASLTALLLLLALGAAQAYASSDDCDGVCTTSGPDTTVTSGPARVTTDRLPQFTFEAPGASGFRCSLGGEPFFDCLSPYTPDLPILSDGDYGFTVFALGPDGQYRGGKQQSLRPGVAVVPGTRINLVVGR